MVAAVMENVAQKVERALKEDCPLYIRFSPQLAKEAREWIDQNLGGGSSRFTDQEAIEIYLGS